MSLMSTLDMRAAAVALAQRGFRVFKLAENGKKALAEGWPATATAWPDAVHKMWSDPVDGDPLHHNIGILADGLLILDPDVKRRAAGLDGLASLADLVDTFGLNTNTFTVRTPTGGRHLYYRLPEGVQVRNSVDTVAPAIDVRGYHGYVVGPGSTLDGVAYEVVNDVELLEAPDWLIRVAGKPRERTAGADLPVSELDAPSDVRRAREYLLKDAPVSAHGSANNTLYKVACRVKDFGISEDENRALIFEHYFDSERCPVAWELDDAAETIANAYKHGKDPVGSSSLAADFDAVGGDGEAGATIEDRRLHKPSNVDFVAWDDIDPLSDPVTPQVDGWFDLGTLVVGYGAPNAGKTHVFLSMAVSVAAGRPWCGCGVRQGGVVYVAAEGGRGLKRRAGAYKRRFGLAAIPFWLRAGALDLMRPDGDIKGFIEKVKACGPVELIVIDTLARVMAGGDENSTKEMGAFVRNCDAIREATGATVLLVHHTGKDVTRGGRGSNALLGAVDTEIVVEPGKVSSTKQRDREHPKPITFGLDVVDLGVDENGRPQSGVVLKQTVASEFEARLTEQEKTLLAAFDDLLLETEIENDDPETDLETRSAPYKLVREVGSRAGLKKTAFHKTLRTLCGLGFIIKTQSGQYIRGFGPQSRTNADQFADHGSNFGPRRPGL